MKDEFALINSVTPGQTKQGGLICGIGDDAALYAPTTGYYQVVCVDSMVEGVHFRKDTLSAYQLGKKALAINLSDIAAMGGIARFYLVSIAVSDTWSEEEIKAMYQGMSDLAGKWDVDLIGGDTVSTKGPFVITVTAIGEVEQGRKLLRKNAEVRDIVFVTGEIGLSAAGFHLLDEHTLNGAFSKEEKILVHAHQEPVPQLEAGRIFVRSGYRFSLNDISDGVASEANEIAEASNVRIELDPELFPVTSTTNRYNRKEAIRWALNGGEDFQLIGTTSKEHFQEIQTACANVGISLTAIGEVTEGQVGVWVKEGQSYEKVAKVGYNHFSK